MENYVLLITLVIIATLCWMAGVVKVLLALALLGAVLAIAADPKPDDDDRFEKMLFSSILLSRAEASVGGVSGAAASMLGRSFNPEHDLDPVGLVQYWRYPAEHHWVTTDDGYVLGIHRVPGGALDGNKRSPKESARPAVILAHPLLSSSAEWVVLGPNKSLAFLLADEGYDVWMFNARGNTYSKNHTTLSTKDAKFWDFSFHEHGVSDMPAMIEYVVKQTGQEQVHYVGFSMGTTLMFVMATMRPDVAKHVKLFTALGPATDLRNSRSRAMRSLARSSATLMKTSAMLGVHQFLPSTYALKRAGEIFCSDGRLTQPLCTALINSLSGKNEKQQNRTLLPRIISRTPAGTSLKNINHFAQIVHKGFHRYDYGLDGNVVRYGKEVPPLYDVSKIQMPVRIIYGLNDLLTDFTDVQDLCVKLPDVRTCEAVADPEWTHLNFVWGKDVVELVYRNVIEGIKQFDNSVDAS